MRNFYLGLALTVSITLPQPIFGNISSTNSDTEPTIFVDEQLSERSPSRRKAALRRDLLFKNLDNTEDFRELNAYTNVTLYPTNNVTTYSNTNNTSASLKIGDSFFEKYIKVSQKEAKVVRGTEAPRNRYPYYAGNGGCGATLVAPRAVLTAAHCQDVFDGSIELNKYFLYKSGRVFNIERKIIHPRFDWWTLNYDYMILILDRTVTGIRPICMSKRKKYEVGQEFWVLGLGTTSYQGMQPAKLRHAPVEYITNGVCSQLNFGDVIPLTMVCAYSPNGRDACQGDSGGPMILRHPFKPNNRNLDILVGIVSWGYDCGVNPGVYANVGSMKKFITGNLRRNNAGNFRWC